MLRNMLRTVLRDPLKTRLGQGTPMLRKCCALLRTEHEGGHFMLRKCCAWPRTLSSTNTLPKRSIGANLRWPECCAEGSTPNLPYPSTPPDRSKWYPPRPAQSDSGPPSGLSLNRPGL